LRGPLVEWGCGRCGIRLTLGSHGAQDVDGGTGGPQLSRKMSMERWWQRGRPGPGRLAMFDSPHEILHGAHDPTAVGHGMVSHQHHNRSVLAFYRDVEATDKRFRCRHKRHIELAFHHIHPGAVLAGLDDQRYGGIRLDERWLRVEYDKQ